MIGSNKVLTEPSYSTHNKEGETYDQSCISRSVFSQVNGLARYKSRYVLKFDPLIALSLLNFESRSTQRFLCSGAGSAAWWKPWAASNAPPPFVHGPPRLPAPPSQRCRASRPRARATAYVMLSASRRASLSLRVRGSESAIAILAESAAIGVWGRSRSLGACL